MEPKVLNEIPSQPLPSGPPRPSVSSTTSAIADFQAAAGPGAPSLNLLGGEISVLRASLTFLKHPTAAGSQRPRGCRQQGPCLMFKTCVLFAAQSLAG